MVGLNEELAKANDYFEVLKPECIEVKVSHEESERLRLSPLFFHQTKEACTEKTRNGWFARSCVMLRSKV